MYVIEYQPRAEDPVVVAEFDTLEEAEAHMEVIRTERPRAADYHYIKNLLTQPTS